VQSIQGHFSYVDGNRKLTLQIHGQVDARGETGLNFGAGGNVRMDVIAPSTKQTVYWDAKACYVTGNGAGSCSEADRRAVVLAIKQRPKTPTPP
jgi:hypothetical protein